MPTSKWFEIDFANWRIGAYNFREGQMRIAIIEREYAVFFYSIKNFWNYAKIVKIPSYNTRFGCRFFFISVFFVQR